LVADVAQCLACSGSCGRTGGQRRCSMQKKGFTSCTVHVGLIAASIRGTYARAKLVAYDPMQHYYLRTSHPLITSGPLERMSH